MHPKQKQNLDPNRSTKTSSSNFTNQNKSYYHRDSIYQKQKLTHNHNHNKSHQVNSQSLIHNHNKSFNKSVKNNNNSQQKNSSSDNNRQNLNSKILAQFKKQQNHQTFTNKPSKINEIGNNSSSVLFKQKQSFNLIQGTKTNLSTTRSNYKPKFILKDLMMQQSKEERIKQHLFSNNDNDNDQEYEQQQNHFFKFKDNNQLPKYGLRNYEQQQQQSVCQQYFKNKSDYQYKQNQNSKTNKNNKNKNSIKFLRFKQHPYLSEQLSQQEQKNLNRQYQQNQSSSDIDQNNISNTFTNSPIASQNYYFCNFNKKSNHNLLDHQNNNKSAILSKRTYIQEDTRNMQQNCRHKEGIINRNFKQISKMKTKNLNKKLRTEENIQQLDYQTDYNQNNRQNYDQGSTISYANTKRSTHRLNNNFNQNIKKSNTNLHHNQSLPKQTTTQTRIRALSQVSNNKSMTKPTNNNLLLSQKPQNYKIPYLQTKKQLQIRTAYFNQAIELCKLVVSNMKQVLTEQYKENQNDENDQSKNSKTKRSSDRIMWVTDRCDELLKTFDQYDGGR